MNPWTIITSAAMGVVGVFGMAVLPPDSQFEPSTPSANTTTTLPTVPPEASQRPLAAPETSATPPEGYCPVLIGLARSEGFTPDEAALLARIGWHESRCDEDILGDLDRGVSYGILQIHGPTWCEPSRYWPEGYLQAALIVESCVDLFDPAIAVKAARAIVNEGGFEQWSTYEQAVNS